MPGWIVLALALLAPPAAADTFLTDLQHAIARNDRRAVASMFQYPATVLTKGARIPVIDAATLVKIYDVAFPPELQGVISLAGVPRAGESRPTYAVTVTADGLSIGAGWVWAKRAGPTYKITRLMIPGGWVALGSTRVPEPERIVLQTGQAEMHYSRTLAPFELRSYVVYALKGQLLQVRINGFRGRDVLMRILDPKTGQPPVNIDTRSVAGARVWSGRVPDSGDYRIDVVRTLPEGSPPPMYVLTVALK